MSSNSNNQGVLFTDKDVIDANQKLLDAIAIGDFTAYQDLTATDVTAISNPNPKDIWSMEYSFTSILSIYIPILTHDLWNEKGGTRAYYTWFNYHVSNPHVRWLGGGCCSDGYVGRVRLR
mmetsp:Transcript_32966/g.69384  ORF Transcript_32966/g.69384 Transcript_32966/m.69384 type:complete len:120 (+) Transcript_32966:100-459(+)